MSEPLNEYIDRCFKEYDTTIDRLNQRVTELEIFIRAVTKGWTIGRTKQAAKKKTRRTRKT